jgi:hydroxyacid-oxoacid transhydrogenase
MLQSTLRFGVGVTREIGDDVKNLGLSKTLVVTDPTVHKLHAFTAVADSLTKIGANFDVFEGVRVEPTDSSFREAIDYARKGGYDSVIAVGGGSAMDTAKAAALLAGNSDADFLDFVVKPFGKSIVAPKPAVPLIAVPTTAGTGSETTCTSVFDFESNHVKSAIRQRAIKPLLAIVDPLNVVSMPRHVAMYSGFDVLCHALESYTAKPFTERAGQANPRDRPTYQGSNPISDVWSREALAIVRKYLKRCVADHDDLEARSNMLLASSYAGVGFGNAGVHLCHGLSYPISGQVKKFVAPDYPESTPLIPHGLSVIMTAVADFKFTAPAAPKRHLEAAGFLGHDTTRAREEDSGNILGDQIKEFMQDFKVSNGLGALGFNSGDIPKLTEAAINSLSALQLAPREQTREALQHIYEDSMHVY